MQPFSGNAWQMSISRSGSGASACAVVPWTSGFGQL